MFIKHLNVQLHVCEHTFVGLSQSKPQDEAAKRKKTDTSTPDDPQEEEKEETKEEKEETKEEKEETIEPKTETEVDQSFIASAEDEEGDEDTKVYRLIHLELVHCCILIMPLFVCCVLVYLFVCLFVCL